MLRRLRRGQPQLEILHLQLFRPEVSNSYRPLPGPRSEGVVARACDMSQTDGGASDTDRRTDAFAWRLVATGLSFALFGIGGLLLGVSLVPVLLAISGDRVIRRQRVRRAIQLSFRSFIGIMRGLGVLTYNLRGFERLGRPGQLVIANHPSLIDVVFLIAFTPGAACVVKQAVWTNPAMAPGVRGAGYVPNHPTDSMIERAAAALDEGQTLIMFPEGTRTRPGEPLRFHRGAAAVATRSASVVTPVFISVVPTTLTKAAPWYRIPSRRPHFDLAVGEDLDPTPLRTAMPGPRAARALNEEFLAIYACRTSAG